MKSKTILTQDDLLSNIMFDSRIDLLVVDVTDERKVQAKIKSIYGCEGQEQDGGIFVGGNDSINKTKYGFGDLVSVLEMLVGENGCPWDKVQTHESIRTNMIEEAYELVAAINNKDVPNMLEECGDVLLQALFHANIAERSGEFDFNDVVHRLCYKLVSRHTHIFGEDKAVDAADALKVWEKAKAKEKTEDLASKLYKIECSTPTLVYAKKAVKELKKAGLLVSDNKVSAEQLLPFVIGLCNSGVDLEAELREQLNDKIKECLGETSKN